MKRTLLTAALAAGLAVGALGAAPPAEARTSTNYWQQAAPVDRYVPNQAAVAKEVLRLVNIERARVGAPPLRQIAALDGVAQRWANRMVATNGYRHNPDFAKQTFATGANRAGENIARVRSIRPTSDAHLARHTFNLWFNSPGHKANILRPQYNAVGFGVQEYSGGGYFLIQNFAGYRTLPAR